MLINLQAKRPQEMAAMLSGLIGRDIVIEHNYQEYRGSVKEIRRERLTLTDGLGDMDWPYDSIDKISLVQE